MENRLDPSVSHLQLTARRVLVRVVQWFPLPQTGCTRTETTWSVLLLSVFIFMVIPILTKTLIKLQLRTFKQPELYTLLLYTCSEQTSNCPLTPFWSTCLTQQYI